MPATSPPVLHARWARFGALELDVRAGELHADGRRTRLQNQPHQLLVLLLEHAGELVAPDAIRTRLWPRDTIVEFELSIGTAVKKLRSALGDDAAAPRFIETLPRRGYRWLLPVEWADARAASSVRSAEPIAARIGTATELVDRPGHTPLVGRAWSLDALYDSLGRVLRRERQIVFVTGEPGIGKTALVDEFQRQVAPTLRGRIARGQCVERYGSQEPYYPVLEAVGQLCRASGGAAIVGTLAAQAPTWLVQFPAFVTREHRETLQREILGATRERMLRELAEVLESLTADDPLLLVLEDLQWVDSSTSELLSALARRREPAKLLVIATHRPLETRLPDHPVKTVQHELLAHRLAREIALQPLSEDDVRQYLGGQSPDATIPDGLDAVVYRHSEGNPLFMTAALEQLTERGFLVRGAGAWRVTRPLIDVRLGVPERLRQLVEAQIDRLNDEERRALEAACVAGATFSVGVTASAVDATLDAAEHVCNELARRSRLIRPAGFQQFADGTVASRYAFVHALYREALYDRLSPARRVRLHQRIGERLELLSEDPTAIASELADHFERGGNWTRAIAYLRLAAEASRRCFARGEAMALLRRALALVPNLPDAERERNEIALREALAATHVAGHARYDSDAGREAHRVTADRAADHDHDGLDR